jgi:dTMP kinase
MQESNAVRIDRPAYSRYSRPLVDGSTRRGVLITVEGIDGAGKSTQVERLAAMLRADGHRVIATREPGATPLGRELRRLVLGRELVLTAEAELLLFLADRAEHVATVIAPALADGAVVLCDRFSDSTIAYQGYGRQADLARVRRWNDESSAGVVPDLTLLLDCAVEVGAERRRREADRYQTLDAGFHERVRQGFLTQAAAEPDRIRRIDAGRDLAAVSADVVDVVRRFLAARGSAPPARAAGR